MNYHGFAGSHQQVVLPGGGGTLPLGKEEGEGQQRVERDGSGYELVSLPLQHSKLLADWPTLPPYWQCKLPWSPLVGAG